VKASAVDVIAAVFLLAMVMTLVRPSSYAPAFIKAFGGAVNEVITFAVTK
jgi:hypothetical protein